MPTRGYRKGLADNKVAAPRRIHTRLPDEIHAALMADAESRSRPASFIIRAILIAHYRQQRIELPHPKGLTAEALREFARHNNNLNQIAHQANMMKLHLVAADARACIASINEAARRLVA